ncbi:GntR family transcriptional regulator [Nocardioides carbamazepini]|jgi:DNA-binding GntR family transcriptional regulator|uniref:GntR family transcriptional regulator n=1 Tax=Nocardioides carbamazepini TaxID=2854259 RepID=UPI0021499B6F|nr:GntR family transcriptional regulator [Nocardioides carbamazepini]MCR1784775.1 GntR family transcriptional regulator [Nocardioides carbamazepini]
MGVDDQGRLEHMQLKDRVYHHLRDGIIDGSYDVGAALREVEIASRLGVSKTPVREAFVRLEKDRLVELIPYRGAVVAGYTAADLEEISQVRQLVEGACARSAARHATEQDIAEIERNIELSREALEKGRVDRVAQLLDAFDQLMYRHSRNKWLDELVENLEGHQRRIGRLTVDIPGRLEKSVEQHQRILDAIRNHDERRAERAMQSHIASVMDDRLKAFVRAS